jgi:hypothetical protein
LKNSLHGIRRRLHYRLKPSKEGDDCKPAFGPCRGHGRVRRKARQENPITQNTEVRTATKRKARTGPDYSSTRWRGLAAPARRKRNPGPCKVLCCSAGCASRGLLSESARHLLRFTRSVSRSYARGLFGTSDIGRRDRIAWRGRP